VFAGIQTGVIKMKWYDIKSNVNALANDLIEDNQFQSLDELQYFHEKPWKWEREWIEFQKSIGKEPHNFEQR